MSDLARWWPLPDRDGLRAQLEAAYGEPARGYHDTTHLAEVLARLDELLPPGHPTRDTVLLAAWFHDAVYDGVPGDDEERSALLAEAELAGTPCAAEVARLVRLTATHDPSDDDLDGGMLCDADLAILAAAPERYAEYTAGVRAEYADFGDRDFRAGRRRVLQGLLDRPRLFRTDAARARWEDAARANLRAEIEELMGRETGPEFRDGP